MTGLRTQNLNSACDLIKDFDIYNIPKKEFEEVDRGSYINQGYKLLSKISSFRKNTPLLKLKREYSFSPITLRQELIKEYLLHSRPYYLNSVIAGRSFFIRQLPNAVWQCFRDAKLLSAQSCEWWDDLQKFVYAKKEHERLDTGRRAERRTLFFEEKRTGKKPKWKALENNLAGYDVLSIKDESSKKSLAIEVKGSLLPIKSAVFYITSGEWKYAMSKDSHCFHIWSLIENKLAILNKKQIKDHVPTDNGGGEWTSVAIKFSSFSNFFFDSDIEDIDPID